MVQLNVKCSACEVLCQIQYIWHVTRLKQDQNISIHSAAQLYIKKFLHYMFLLVLLGGGLTK